jgi:hypothetical protein
MFSHKHQKVQPSQLFKSRYKAFLNFLRKTVDTKHKDEDQHQDRLFFQKPFFEKFIMTPPPPT